MFKIKTIVVIFFVLGLQFFAQAYDPIELKERVASITKFVQELRKENNPQAAAWFENKVADISNTTDDDIATIAIMADKYQSKIELKTKMLKYIMTILSAGLAEATILGGIWLKFELDFRERKKHWTD